MRLGASIWRFEPEPPYEDAIRRLAGIGFRAVELIANSPEVLAGYYTPQRNRQLRDLLHSEGMILSQFVAKPGLLASGDDAVRAAAVDTYKRYADVAVDLGAPLINTVADFPFGIKVPSLLFRPGLEKFTVDVPPGLDWERNWEQYVEALGRCVAYAEQLGLRHSIEPHPSRYGGSTEGALRLLEAVGSSAFGVNFDPSHLFPLGEIPHISVYQLNKRIFHCHVSDNNGDTNAHWRPGLGKIDWQSLFEALNNVGFDGTISVELEEYTDGSSGSSQSRVARSATPAFIEENAIALHYLEGLAHEVGMKVE